MLYGITLAVAPSDNSAISPLIVCLKTDLTSGKITEGKIYEDSTTSSIIVKAIYISKDNAALALYQNIVTWDVGTATIDFDKKTITYKIIQLGTGLNSDMPLGVIQSSNDMIYALNLKQVNKTTTQLLSSKTYKSGFIFSSNSSMTCMVMKNPWT